jgi:hypothetical protein
MKKSNIALIMIVALATVGSSLGALNFVLSEQNRPNDKQNDYKTYYDYSGGVDLFKRGIHIIATSYDPVIYKNNFPIINDYWKKLKENETNIASSDDIISIIISRGDFPTGGYTIQVESFSWLESYPVKLRLHVNFTDPGDSVIVTQALTNPLVLLPLGKLDPGEYNVEIHVTQYIMNFDEQGNPIYTQILTFKEEVWTESFIVQ